MLRESLALQAAHDWFRIQILESDAQGTDGDVEGWASATRESYGGLIARLQGYASRCSVMKRQGPTMGHDETLRPLAGGGSVREDESNARPPGSAACSPSSERSRARQRTV
jgi:hypothetical protein